MPAPTPAPHSPAGPTRYWVNVYPDPTEGQPAPAYELLDGTSHHPLGGPREWCEVLEVFDRRTGDVVVNNVECGDTPGPLSEHQRDTALAQLGFTRLGPWHYNDANREQAWADVRPLPWAEAHYPAQEDLEKR